MRAKAIEAFRADVNADASLRSPFLAALQQGPDVVVAMAKNLGYAFSIEAWLAALPAMAQTPMTPLEQEAKQILLQGHDELADYELDLVSAGNNSGCAGDGTRSKT